MTETTNLIGQVCESDLGRLGIVTGHSWGGWGLPWVGVALEDGSPWSSREPKFIRPADRGDLVNALALALKKLPDLNQEHFTSQLADMPESTTLLVLEMVRSQMAEHASRMHRQHERWMDV